MRIIEFVGQKCQLVIIEKMIEVRASSNANYYINDCYTSSRNACMRLVEIASRDVGYTKSHFCPCETLLPS